MNTDSNTSKEPLRIREDSDAERSIVFHPEDDDLFVRTGRQVIEASRLGISIEVWLHEFREMLQAVRRWCEEHADRVHACYAGPRGAGLGLFFIPRGARYDFDLADLLTPLNGQLVNEFNIGMIEIYQIPESEISRFVAPNAARIVYAYDRSASSTVES